MVNSVVLAFLLNDKALEQYLVVCIWNVRYDVYSDILRGGQIELRGGECPLPPPPERNPADTPLQGLLPTMEGGEECTSSPWPWEL